MFKLTPSLLFLSTSIFVVFSLSPPSKPTVAVVGGGISGLTIAHVLEMSGNYQVEVLEASSYLGGHIRYVENPLNPGELLNIGHATHMGLFCNLRWMLKHFHVKEVPVGRGSNDKPGLFRMISVTGTNGETFQPPLHDITSPAIWWEAFRFYFGSFLTPEERLDGFLSRNHFSKQFLDILYWAMATFEFDKYRHEADEYALGAARALLITQVFFQYLLCDAFDGSLPAKVDSGLKDDLASRIMRLPNMTTKRKVSLVERFRELTSDAPLASYFTADYGAVVHKLAERAGRVRTNAQVTRVLKKNGRNIVETLDGDAIEADHVVFTTHPSIVARVLCTEDYPQHLAAIDGIESGTVGVQIIHSSDLSFPYPPRLDSTSFDMDSPIAILGIFDISQLTTMTNHGEHHISPREAGWLSVAYPVYKEASLNHHKQLLEQIPYADTSVYPWTRATPSFIDSRRDIVKLQGTDGIYMTGQALTGVNKASELQVTNALNLCHDHFGVTPPWETFVACPMLPDCNDVDAFYKAKSRVEAAFLAIKSLVGSFLLASAVSILGKDFFN
jgi:hypothetical protein